MLNFADFWAILEGELKTDLSTKQIIKSDFAQFTFLERSRH